VQPKYSIFKSFHSLLLMAEGEVAYHGRGDGVVPYFAGLGYVPEAFNNPADWVLDILNEDGPTGRYDTTHTLHTSPRISSHILH
jgi:hypothetical protein